MTRKGSIAAGAKAGKVELFREMSDFRRAGEIEGLSIDPVNDDLVVLNNRGTQIIWVCLKVHSPKKAIREKFTNSTSTKRLNKYPKGTNYTE